MKEKEMQLQKCFEEGMQNELKAQGFSLNEAEAYMKLFQISRCRRLNVKQNTIPENQPSFFEALKKWPALSIELLEKLSNDVECIVVDYYSLKQHEKGYIVFNVSKNLKITIHTS